MMPDGTDPDVEARCRADADGALRGSVISARRPDRRFVVELVVDGLPVATVRADAFDPGVAVGDGCYGFSLSLPPGARQTARWIEVGLANADRPFATFSGPLPSRAEPRATEGRVRWAGGLTLLGWMPGDPGGPEPVVRALVDGDEVAQERARAWEEVGGVRRLARAFSLRLPEFLADGRVHTVEVVDEAGEPLDGSPLPVFALPDGFAALLDAGAEAESERVRARFADGLLPRGVPFSAFAAWRARFPYRPGGSPEGGRVLVLVVGEAGLEATLASLEGQPSPAWEVAVLPSTSSAVSFARSSLSTLLASDPSGYALVVATLAGTRFEAGALSCFAAAAEQFPGADAFYSDLRSGSEGQEILGFPAYDDELFLEQGYGALAFALRPSAAAEREGAGSLFELFPDRPGAGSPERRPVHIPAPLAALPVHDGLSLTAALKEATEARLAGRGVTAEVAAQPAGGRAAVRVRRAAPDGRATVVIASRNDAVGLGATLDGLRATVDPDLVEVVIADGGSSRERVLDLLGEAEAGGMRVLRLDRWASRAALLGSGAAQARTDRLLFLSTGVVPRTGDALAELVSRLAGSGCGAVGGLVATEAGLVASAGFVLGPRFSAKDRFGGHHVDEPGYAGWLQSAQEVSAVSSDCLLTRRSSFEGVGGFDGRAFPEGLFDIDYALRLRARGERVVLAPQARFVHVEGAAALHPPGASHERHRTALRDRWALAPGCDPFYSPWMATDGETFSGLAWPPPWLGPRQPDTFQNHAGRSPAGGEAR